MQKLWLLGYAPCWASETISSAGLGGSLAQGEPLCVFQTCRDHAQCEMPLLSRRQEIPQQQLSAA